MICSYVMGIGEAEAFSERLKRELLALEAANVHAILESEPLIDEVLPYITAALWIEEHSFSFFVVRKLELLSPAHSHLLCVRFCQRCLTILAMQE